MLPFALAGPIWDGGGTNDNINTAENWDADTLPALTGSTSDLVFTGTSRLGPAINIPINPLSIRFDAAAGSFVLSGAGPIAIGAASTTANGNITNANPLAQVIDAPLIWNRGTLNTQSGDLVINGPINIGGGSASSGRSLRVEGNRDVFLNGTIEGTGTSASDGGVLSKFGDGVLHITGNSPLWQGRLGIDEGRLRATAPDALGDPNSRTLVQGGGTTGNSRLELAGNVTFAPERLELTGRELGLAPVHLSNVSGNNTWTGNSILRTGGAEYGFESIEGKLTITGNIVNESGNATARTVRFAGASEGEFAGLFQDGAGTGALTLRKEGTGTWTFSNPLFSYAGDTLVTGGTLAFAPGILVNSAIIDIAPGATLAVGNLDSTTGRTLRGGGTLKTDVTDSGAAFIPGHLNTPGTLTVDGNLTFTGGGTLNFDLASVTTPGGNVNDLVATTMNLSLAGTTNIVLNPLNAALAKGSYRLFNYAGTLTGDATNLELAFGPTRQVTTIDTATPNQVNLVVSGDTANLVWMGGSAGIVWDVNTSSNWKNGATSDKFFNLDHARFDDTAGAAATSVTLNETVVPGSVTVDSALDFIFSGTGRISGATALAKSGTGRLTIATNNDNSGVTTINAGIVQVGAGSNRGSLGAGNIVNNGGLVFNRSTGLTVPGVISGTGSLEKGGAGTITLAADNTYTGTTAITRGTLAIGDGGTTGSIGPGDVVNNGELALNRSSDLVMPNLISGTGAIDKSGTGMIELTALSTYTGPTTINGSSSLGGLVVRQLAGGGAPSNLGAAAPDAATLHIRTGGTLRYVGTGATTDRLFTIGNARLEASGTGPLVFTAAGPIATSGGNRMLTLAGANKQDNTLAPAIVDGEAGGVTSLTKNGDGTWILSGDSSFSGVTSLTAGTLRLASVNALGAITTGTTIIGDVGGSGTLELTGGLNFAAEPLTLQARQGITAVIPHLVNRGGDNQWSGPITLTTGGFEYTLQSDAGTLTIDTDITQTATTLERFLNLQGAGNGVVNGIIANGGGSQAQTVRKRGAGTWTLHGVNTYAGATHVEGGTLRIGPAGTVVNNGDVSVAAGATFDVDGMVSIDQITGAGTVSVGPDAVLTARQIRQSLLRIDPIARAMLAPDGGTSVLGDLQIFQGGPVVPGTLDVANNDLVVQSTAANKANDFARLHQLLEIGFNAGNWAGNGITSSTAAGNPNTDTTLSLVDNALLGYTDFSGVPVTADSILLKYTYYGDIDQNGQVDADDLTVFANNFGRTSGATQVDGDIDFNGTVDADDLTVFANNFLKGVGSPLGAGGIEAVPEPGTLLLAACGIVAVALTARRKRRRRT
jgi:autotransporter-associated beta strand protein